MTALRCIWLPRRADDSAADWAIVCAASATKGRRHPVCFRCKSLPKDDPVSVVVQTVG
jgi:hypothetical protein